MPPITRNFCLSLFIVILISAGCKTVESPSSKKGASAAGDTAAVSGVEEESSALVKMLNKHRSKLRDVYVSQRHDMPKAFLKKDSVDESINSNPFDGYRVQILSTRDKQVADSVAKSFRVWSDTTLAGYKASAYESFRQPYYKVQVGDFQLRNRANSFSQLIKQKYPDAWVVHDRINPDRVPADTVQFRMKKTQSDSIKSPPLRNTNKDSL